MPYLYSILQEKQIFFEKRKFVKSGVNLQMSEKITRKGNDLSFELAGFSTNRGIPLYVATLSSVVLFVSSSGFTINNIAPINARI